MKKLAALVMALVTILSLTASAFCIEVDLGNGVSIFTKMFEGKKYYGTASRDVDEDSLVVVARYPDIDHVLTLKTVGLNSTGDVVKLSVDYDGYYVYDKDLHYLGRASDPLPFSAKYYLANRELAIESGIEPEEDDEYEIPAETGGDAAEPASTVTGAPANANANPGTGR